jgi:hypothetical protein
VASLASRCTSNTIVFFMGKQLARHRTRGQGSRIAAAAPLNYEFAMYRRGHLPPRVCCRRTRTVSTPQATCCLAYTIQIAGLTEFCAEYEM